MSEQTLETDTCPTDQHSHWIRQDYLDLLIEKYIMFAVDSADEFKSRDLTPRSMETYFEGDPGYWWCRHMVPKGKLTGTGMFCIANVTVPERIRGQGIFGEFLDYVISHPFHFTGVEVESIFEDRLIEYLKGRGFVVKHKHSWGRPTMQYTFQKEES